MRAQSEKVDASLLFVYILEFTSKFDPHQLALVPVEGDYSGRLTTWIPFADEAMYSHLSCAIDSFAGLCSGRCELLQAALSQINTD